VDDYRSGKLHVATANRARRDGLHSPAMAVLLFDNLTARASGRRNMFLTGAVQESRCPRTSRLGREPSARADGTRLRARGDRGAWLSSTTATRMPPVAYVGNAIDRIGAEPRARRHAHGGAPLRASASILVKNQMIEAHAPKFGFGEGFKGHGICVREGVMSTSAA